MEEEEIRDPLLDNYGQPPNQLNILIELEKLEQIEINNTCNEGFK